VSHQQDVVNLIDADDPKDKDDSRALPAALAEISEHRFQLCGIHTQLNWPHPD
jgi:hypothetical protein